jgi:Holliday junction resolvasome RuvABC endonuclease subunit
MFDRMSVKATNRILAIDIHYRGIGYAVLEGLGFLIDWGVADTPTNKAAGALRRVDILISRYRPEAVVLEDCNCDRSRRCRRVRELIGLIRQATIKRGVRVQLCTPCRIRSLWAACGAGTKVDVASAIGRLFPELAPYVPPERAFWKKEAYRMPMFTAVGLAVAFFAYEGKTGTCVAAAHRSTAERPVVPTRMLWPWLVHPLQSALLGPLFDCNRL